MATSMPVLRVDQASDWAQLVYHLLAHIPIADPSNLYAPEYVKWSATQLPAPLTDRLTRDLPLLGALLAQQPEAGRTLHALPLLHASIEEHLASGQRSVDELQSSDVRSPWLLAELQHSLPQPFELFRIITALSAKSFQTHYFRALDTFLDDAQNTVNSLLEQAVALDSRLARFRLSVVPALGTNARGLDRWILAGCPSPWNPMPPERTIVLFLHECAVLHAPGNDYFSTEWHALRALSASMQSASIPLQNAHRTWLASLALDSLIEFASQHSLLRNADAQTLRTQPSLRPQLLASLADGTQP